MSKTYAFDGRISAYPIFKKYYVASSVKSVETGGCSDAILEIP